MKRYWSEICAALFLAVVINCFGGVIVYASSAEQQITDQMELTDLQSMVDRYAIIRQAELYHDDIAVVALEDECDRVTAAKAADELLTIRGIKASFVLYRKGEGVYMSARSLGEVNVQVILEALGL